MKRILPFKRITFSLGCLFIVFVILYNNHERTRIQKAIEQHAQVVSASLWKLDKTSQAAYLNFVAEHNNYKIISVLGHDGEIFLSASAHDPNWYEEKLHSLALIPSFHFSAPVIYENQIIGSVEATWYRRTIYKYIYIFCILFLILNVIYFYTRLLQSNLLLEKRVEERTAKLKTSELKFKLLFETAGDALFMIKDGVIIDCNEKTLELFNCSREQLIGQRPSRFSPEVQPDGKKSEEKALNLLNLTFEGEPQHFIWHHLKYDGTPFYAEVGLNNFEMRGEQYLQAIVRDITDRKHAEDALKKSEEKYATLVEEGNDIILILQDDIIKYANSKMTSLTGYSQEKIIGLHGSEFISPPYRELVLDRAQKRLAGEKVPSIYEIDVITEDGRTVPVEINASIIDYENSPAVMLIMRDISERKKAEEQLQLVQYSIEHSAFPFEWIQSDSRFLYVNEATCRSLGYTREELCSMEVFDIDSNFPPETWPEFWEKLVTDKSLTFETYHYKKNGEKFPVEILANYVEFEGTEHVFAYVKDISEKIRAEENRKELEQKLFQAQKMEAIGTLAGGIAHDFNNILSGIFGFTELAKMDINDPDNLQSDLQGVSTGAERAKELVKQILTFSRKTEIEKQPLQLSLIIKEALKLIRSSIPSSIEIKQHLQSNALILGDPTQMHQVIMNLCTNAYHSMKEDGGYLTIFLTESEVDELISSQYSHVKTGPYLKLTVEDTGRGMGRETMDKIFEPYFTTKETGEGTGLGLAVVNGIIVQSGGFIRTSSELGKGTSFDIFIPIYTPQRDETSIVKSEQTPLPIGTERVLFVDDEQEIRHLALKVLTKYGYQVTVFSDGFDAWQEYNNQPGRFDIIVTDMSMPRVNGIELAQKILRKDPYMPVILCTGYSDLVNRDVALAMGIAEYLLKPLEMSDIAHVIRNVLARKAIKASKLL